jgi:hypothetical protein
MHTQQIHLTILCVFCENVIVFMKINNCWGNAHNAMNTFDNAYNRPLHLTLVVMHTMH